jgi:E3 ubiquitin-protein ligase HUWE1
VHRINRVLRTNSKIPLLLQGPRSAITEIIRHSARAEDDCAMLSNFLETQQLPVLAPSFIVSAKQVCDELVKAHSSLKAKGLQQAFVPEMERRDDLLFAPATLINAMSSMLSPGAAALSISAILKADIPCLGRYALVRASVKETEARMQKIAPATSQGELLTDSAALASPFLDWLFLVVLPDLVYGTQSPKSKSSLETIEIGVFQPEEDDISVAEAARMEAELDANGGCQAFAESVWQSTRPMGGATRHADTALYRYIRACGSAALAAENLVYKFLKSVGPSHQIIDIVLRRLMIAVSIAASAGSSSSKASPVSVGKEGSLFPSERRRVTALASLATLTLRIMNALSEVNASVALKGGFVTRGFDLLSAKTGQELAPSAQISQEIHVIAMRNGLVRMTVHGLGDAWMQAHKTIDLNSALSPRVASAIMRIHHQFLRPDVRLQVRRAARDYRKLAETVSKAFAAAQLALISAIGSLNESIMTVKAIASTPSTIAPSTVPSEPLLSPASGAGDADDAKASGHHNSHAELAVKDALARVLSGLPKSSEKSQMAHALERLAAFRKVHPDALSSWFEYLSLFIPFEATGEQETKSTHPGGANVSASSIFVTGNDEVSRGDIGARKSEALHTAAGAAPSLDIKQPNSRHDASKDHRAKISVLEKYTRAANSTPSPVTLLVAAQTALSLYRSLLLSGQMPLSSPFIPKVHPRLLPFYGPSRDDVSPFSLSSAKAVVGNTATFNFAIAWTFRRVFEFVDIFDSEARGGVMVSAASPCKDGLHQQVTSAEEAAKPPPNAASKKALLSASKTHSSVPQIPMAVAREHGSSKPRAGKGTVDSMRKSPSPPGGPSAAPAETLRADPLTPFLNGLQQSLITYSSVKQVPHLEWNTNAKKHRKRNGSSSEAESWASTQHEEDVQEDDSEDFMAYEDEDEGSEDENDIDSYEEESLDDASSDADEATVGSTDDTEEGMSETDESDGSEDDDDNAFAGMIMEAESDGGESGSDEYAEGALSSAALRKLEAAGNGDHNQDSDEEPPDDGASDISSASSGDDDNSDDVSDMNEDDIADIMEAHGLDNAIFADDDEHGNGIRVLEGNDSDNDVGIDLLGDTREVVMDVDNDDEEPSEGEEEEEVDRETDARRGRRSFVGMDPLMPSHVDPGVDDANAASASISYEEGNGGARDGFQLLGPLLQSMGRRGGRSMDAEEENPFEFEVEADDGDMFGLEDAADAHMFHQFDDGDDDEADEEAAEHAYAEQEEEEEEEEHQNEDGEEHGHQAALLHAPYGAGAGAGATTGSSTRLSNRLSRSFQAGASTAPTDATGSLPILASSYTFPCIYSTGHFLPSPLQRLDKSLSSSRVDTLNTRTQLGEDIEAALSDMYNEDDTMALFDSYTILQTPSGHETRDREHVLWTLGLFSNSRIRAALIESNNPLLATTPERFLSPDLLFTRREILRTSAMVGMSPADMHDESKSDESESGSQSNGDHDHSSDDSPIVDELDMRRRAESRMRRHAEVALRQPVPIAGVRASTAAAPAPATSSIRGTGIPLGSVTDFIFPALEEDHGGEADDDDEAELQAYLASSDAERQRRASRAAPEGDEDVQDARMGLFDIRAASRRGTQRGQGAFLPMMMRDSTDASRIIFETLNRAPRAFRLGGAFPTAPTATGPARSHPTMEYDASRPRQVREESTVPGLDAWASAPLAANEGTPANGFPTVALRTRSGKLRYLTRSSFNALDAEELGVPSYFSLSSENQAPLPTIAPGSFVREGSHYWAMGCISIPHSTIVYLVDNGLYESDAAIRRAIHLPAPGEAYDKSFAFPYIPLHAVTWRDLLPMPEWDMMGHSAMRPLYSPHEQSRLHSDEAEAERTLTTVWRKLRPPHATDGVAASSVGRYSRGMFVPASVCTAAAGFGPAFGPVPLAYMIADLWAKKPGQSIDALATENHSRTGLLPNVLGARVKMFGSEGSQAFTPVGETKAAEGLFRLLFSPQSVRWTSTEGGMTVPRHRWPLPILPIGQTLCPTWTPSRVRSLCEALGKGLSPILGGGIVVSPGTGVLMDAASTHASKRWLSARIFQLQIALRRWPTPGLRRESGVVALMKTTLASRLRFFHQQLQGSQDTVGSAESTKSLVAEIQAMHAAREDALRSGRFGALLELQDVEGIDAPPSDGIALAQDWENIYASLIARVSPFLASAEVGKLIPIPADVSSENAMAWIATICYMKRNCKGISKQSWRRDLERRCGPIQHASQAVNAVRFEAAGSYMPEKAIYSAAKALELHAKVAQPSAWEAEANLLVSRGLFINGFLRNLIENADPLRTGDNLVIFFRTLSEQFIPFAKHLIDFLERMRKLMVDYVASLIGLFFCPFEALAKASFQYPNIFDDALASYMFGDNGTDNSRQDLTDCLYLALSLQGRVDETLSKLLVFSKSAAKVLLDLRSMVLAVANVTAESAVYELPDGVDDAPVVNTSLVVPEAVSSLAFVEPKPGSRYALLVELSGDFRLSYLPTKLGAQRDALENAPEVSSSPSRTIRVVFDSNQLMQVKHMMLNLTVMFSETPLAVITANGTGLDTGVQDSVCLLSALTNAFVLTMKASVKTLIDRQKAANSTEEGTTGSRDDSQSSTTMRLKEAAVKQSAKIEMLNVPTTLMASVSVKQPLGYLELGRLRKVDGNNYPGVSLPAADARAQYRSPIGGSMNSMFPTLNPLVSANMMAPSAPAEAAVDIRELAADLARRMQSSTQGRPSSSTLATVPGASSAPAPAAPSISDNLVRPPQTTTSAIPPPTNVAPLNRSGEPQSHSENLVPTPVGAQDGTGLAASPAPAVSDAQVRESVGGGTSAKKADILQDSLATDGIGMTDEAGMNAVLNVLTSAGYVLATLAPMPGGRLGPVSTGELVQTSAIQMPPPGQDGRPLLPMGPGPSPASDRNGVQVAGEQRAAGSDAGDVTTSTRLSAPAPHSTAVNARSLFLTGGDIDAPAVATGGLADLAGLSAGMQDVIAGVVAAVGRATAAAAAGAGMRHESRSRSHSTASHRTGLAQAAAAAAAAASNGSAAVAGHIPRISVAVRLEPFGGQPAQVLMEVQSAMAPGASAGPANFGRLLSQIGHADSLQVDGGAQSMLANRGRQTLGGAGGNSGMELLANFFGSGPRSPVTPLQASLRALMSNDNISSVSARQQHQQPAAGYITVSTRLQSRNPVVLSYGVEPPGAGFVEMLSRPFADESDGALLQRSLVASASGLRDFDRALLSQIPVDVSADQLAASSASNNMIVLRLSDRIPTHLQSNRAEFLAHHALDIPQLRALRHLRDSEKEVQAFVMPVDNAEAPLSPLDLIHVFKLFYTGVPLSTGTMSVFCRHMLQNNASSRATIDMVLRMIADEPMSASQPLSDMGAPSHTTNSTITSMAAVWTDVNAISVSSKNTAAAAAEFPPAELYRMIPVSTDGITHMRHYLINRCASGSLVAPTPLASGSVGRRWPVSYTTVRLLNILLMMVQSDARVSAYLLGGARRRTSNRPVGITTGTEAVAFAGKKRRRHEGADDSVLLPSASSASLSDLLTSPIKDRRVVCRPKSGHPRNAEIEDDNPLHFLINCLSRANMKVDPNVLSAHVSVIFALLRVMEPMSSALVDVTALKARSILQKKALEVVITRLESLPSSSTADAPQSEIQQQLQSVLLDMMTKGTSVPSSLYARLQQILHIWKPLDALERAAVTPLVSKPAREVLVWGDASDFSHSDEEYQGALGSERVTAFLTACCTIVKEASARADSPHSSDLPIRSIASICVAFTSVVSTLLELAKEKGCNEILIDVFAKAKDTCARTWSALVRKVVDVNGLCLINAEEPLTFIERSADTTEALSWPNVLTMRMVASDNVWQRVSAAGEDTHMDMGTAAAASSIDGAPTSVNEIDIAQVNTSLHLLSKSLLFIPGYTFSAERKKARGTRESVVYPSGEVLLWWEPSEGYACPLCELLHPGTPFAAARYGRGELVRHVVRYHEKDSSRNAYMVVCPICSVSPAGNATYKSKNFHGHVQLRHFWTYEHKGYGTGLAVDDNRCPEEGMDESSLSHAVLSSRGRVLNQGSTSLQDTIGGAITSEEGMLGESGANQGSPGGFSASGAVAGPTPSNGHPALSSPFYGSLAALSMDIPASTTPTSRFAVVAAPLLPKPLMHTLAKVLTYPTCTPAIAARVDATMRLLAAIPANRRTAYEILTMIAGDLASISMRELETVARVADGIARGQGARGHHVVGTEGSAKAVAALTPLYESSTVDEKLFQMLRTMRSVSPAGTVAVMKKDGTDVTVLVPDPTLCDVLAEPDVAEASGNVGKSIGNESMGESFAHQSTNFGTPSAATRRSALPIETRKTSVVGLRRRENSTTESESGHRELPLTPFDELWHTLHVALGLVVKAEGLRDTDTKAAGSGATGEKVLERAPAITAARHAPLPGTRHGHIGSRSASSTHVATPAIAGDTGTPAPQGAVDSGAAAAGAGTDAVSGPAVPSSTDSVPDRMKLILQRFGPMIIALFQYHPVAADPDFVGTAADPATVAQVIQANRTSGRNPRAPFGAAAAKNRIVEPPRKVQVPIIDDKLLNRIKGSSTRETLPVAAAEAAILHADQADTSSATRENISLGSSSISAGAVQDSSPNAETAVAEKTSAVRRRLVRFVQDHKEAVNALMRVEPLLLTNALLPLISVRECRVFMDFNNKRSYFRSQLKAYQASRGGIPGPLSLRIRRADLLWNSFVQVLQASPDDLRGRVEIRFEGEEGVDAGGLTREWYEILARKVFDPNNALFQVSDDGTTLQPSPNSHFHDNHLQYFKFVGRVIGKAIADGQLLDAHFTRSFYKHMLGVPVTYHDIEAIDPQFYKSMNDILNMEIDDLYLEMYFSAEQEFGGNSTEVELVPGGKDIPVTDANKWEYVQLMAAHKMTSSIRAQMDAFLSGFHDVVPPSLISIFTESELELLIAGLPSIDIADLKANTEYQGYRPFDEVVQWFWAALESFDQQDLARFLMFVTGTSKVPLGGFKALRGQRGAQKFTIEKTTTGPTSLPQSHTCFNTLSLPAYTDPEDLREKLLIAIREAGEGFGLV